MYANNQSFFLERQFYKRADPAKERETGEKETKTKTDYKILKWPLIIS